MEKSMRLAAMLRKCQETVNYEFFLQSFWSVLSTDIVRLGMRKMYCSILLVSMSHNSCMAILQLGREHNRVQLEHPGASKTRLGKWVGCLVF